MLVAVCLLDDLIITVVCHWKPASLNSHRLSSLYYKGTDESSALATFLWGKGKIARICELFVFEVNYFSKYLNKQIFGILGKRAEKTF